MIRGENNDGIVPETKALYTIEKLADEADGKYKVGKVNVDEQQSLAVDHKVSSIPQLSFFKGGKEVKRLQGLQQESLLKESLEELAD